MPIFKLMICFLEILPPAALFYVKLGQKPHMPLFGISERQTELHTGQVHLFGFRIEGNARHRHTGMRAHMHMRHIMALRISSSKGRDGHTYRHDKPHNPSGRIQIRLFHFFHSTIPPGR